MTDELTKLHSVVDFSKAFLAFLSDFKDVPEPVDFGISSVKIIIPSRGPRHGSPSPSHAVRVEHGIVLRFTKHKWGHRVGKGAVLIEGLNRHGIHNDANHSEVLIIRGCIVDFDVVVIVKKRL